MDRLDCSKTRTMAIGQRVALLLVRNLVAFTLLVLSLPSLSLSFHQHAWTSHNRRAAVFRGPTAISQGTPCQQQRHVRYRPIVGLGAGGGAGAGGGGGERDGSSSFRTEVDVAPWPMVNYLTYADSFLLIGSCFSDNVGERLRVSKFHSAVNPSHGLLFSPLSMADSLDRMASGVPYSESEPGVVFCEDTGLFCSLEHHSSFSKTSRKACLEGMNAALARGRESLLSATCVFLTLGTAWVFRHRQLDKDVANCHKLPAYEFDRRILPVQEIASRLYKSIANIFHVNPEVRVLLTVSPVRHWRDGPVENARSKAHLLAGAHGAIDLLHEAGFGGAGVGGPGYCGYFPSFEIMNDDLRDYRFFEADMIHPNNVAVDYIWEKLVEAMFSDEAINTMAEVDKVMQAKGHKPFNPRSDGHQKFLRRQLEILDRLQRTHPNLELDEEREFFQSHVLEAATT